MKNKTFAHIVFQTPRFQEMQDWYCTVLEAHIVFKNQMLSFLTFDEEHHRIAFLAAPPGAEMTAKTPATVGMQHSAYTFDSLNELLDHYKELKAKGIVPHIPIQHGVTTSLYYKDPDNNFVELQIDNFSTPEEATAYMEGPEYSANPVGVAFDPEKMIEALESGQPVREIITQTWAAENCHGLPDPLEKLTSF